MPFKKKFIERTEGRSGRKVTAGLLASAVTFLGQESVWNWCCREPSGYRFRLDNVADDLEKQTAFSFEVMLNELPPGIQLEKGQKWFDRRGTTLSISEVKIPGTGVAGAWEKVTPIKTPEILGLRENDQVGEGRLRRALEMLDRPLEQSKEVADFLYRDKKRNEMLAGWIEEWRRNPDLLRMNDGKMKEILRRLCEASGCAASDINEGNGPIREISLAREASDSQRLYEAAEPDTVHALHQAIALEDAYNFKQDISSC